MVKNDIILITGGGGFIGFQTLLLALKKGYHVRAAVRNDSKIQIIRDHPEVKKLCLSSDDLLTFTIVPDITARGAYVEAVKGVQYVFHIASPIPQQNIDGHKDADRVFIRPARNGVLEMLNAAKGEPGIRKVIITSSAAALVPGKLWSGMELSDRKINGSARTETPDGPFSNAGQAYQASKVSALNATDEWMAREQPGFVVVNVFPSWVLGPAILAKSRSEVESGTNRYLVAVATGRVEELIGDRRLAGASVHVEDVALVHLLAVEENIKGYKNLVASSPMKWQNISDMVQQYTPAAVEDGLFTAYAVVPTIPLNLDGSETERLLNFKFRGLGDQVKDVLQQYQSLPESV